jgi:hypothetical protein
MGDKIEKNEMGGACSLYGGEEGIHRVLGGNLREGDHLEGSVVEEMIILK